MIQEATFCAFAVCGGFVALVSGVCEEVASLALFGQFGFSWDTERDQFAK
jgi:hypothetical protein